MRAFLENVWSLIVRFADYFIAVITVIFNPPLVGEERRLIQAAGFMLLLGIAGGAYKAYSFYLTKSAAPFRFECTDLRDKAEYSFRNDYPNQIEGKYQIKPGVYIDRHEKIKCLEKRIEPEKPSPKKADSASKRTEK